ncbi:DNA translocase FtsK [Desulfovulcanus sp.]
MNGNKLFREILAFFFLFLTLLLSISLFTFWPNDPGFNSVPGPAVEVHNQAGLIGAYLAGLFVDLFGLGSFLWIFLFLYLALILIWPKFKLEWWNWLGVILFYLSLLTWLEFPWFKQVSFLKVCGSGFLGKTIFNFAYEYLRLWGTTLVTLFTSLLSLQLTLGFSWEDVGRKLHFRCVDFWTRIKERRSEKKKIKFTLRKQKKEKKFINAAQEKQEKGAAKTNQEPAHSSQNSSPKPKNFKGYSLPPTELLSLPENQEIKVDDSYLKNLAEKVQTCLADFSIQGEVQKVQPGPVITMLEFKPAPGVKISKIASLNDDLALALKASSVRIVAPLPGRDTVGIEIPNIHRQTVFLREIIESKVYTQAKAKLPLALGKDIQGQPRVADLAKMPHLLVAGATGAGKSVCLNSLILSLLFRSAPDEVQLLLVDPKRIELSVYNDLPHLVHPVVTDMSLAKTALDWAVYEMEQRYEAMAILGVRNIEGYNQKLSSFGQNIPEQFKDLKPIPYLVIIIDELADLMLTAAKEVEVSIVRLAQLARAAGIHLILATQRPSVDVVTGIIKANFPSRIAFQVSSKHDSRTILDAVGAEYLLGQGDMLFKTSGGHLMRIHGAYVGDQEIADVVDFWKSRSTPSFELDFSEWKSQKEKSSAPGSGDDPIIDDPKYGQAVEFVLEQGKASISMIQRRFRIGYNKAALFVEQMERDGILGPAEGSKPRRVIVRS